MIGLGLGLGLAFGATRIATSRTPDDPASVGSEQVASASVTVAIAEREPIQQTIETTGTVEAFDLLSVSPRASGLQILSVLVREGDRVEAGQVLAVLDDSVLRAQMDQARAQVSAARAQVVQAEAQVAQNRATLAEAQERVGRYESLFAKGAISAEELASRRTTAITEGQTVGSAIAAVDSAEATVRSAQAEVDRLMTQLAQTEVLAPASGVIASKTATVGDTASAGNPLFEIISGDQLDLAVKIPQTQLAQINLGTTVRITSGSDANLQLQGQVRSIDPTVDPQTRQATVKIGLPGSERLRPGMFLKAAIVTGSQQGVVVPADAVLPQPSGDFIVYTVAGGSSAEPQAVQAQSVEVGTRIPAKGDEPAKIEIANGLPDGAAVVTEGASYLQDGELVEVVR
ncbi:MAG: efflux RND transporter periplasmic adaptor subunit [Leptolyngbya foveolarum]|uniref:Efflux RND transporter periplasmic adaptor subunit n=1 Tax=Leptolyngbya foveolarum TaxID=47253 RepID=A0A2W4UFQ7_9CYAN|nr:MAG: efflux RND transporter periplasmic adaptor subunit [Leptolyngbya foveolarum]